MQQHERQLTNTGTDTNVARNTKTPLFIAGLGQVMATKQSSNVSRGARGEVICIPRR